MHKPEFIQENEMHKILGNFEIQIDPLILAKRPGQVVINNEKGYIPSHGFYCPNIPQSKNQSKKRDKYLDLVRERKSCGT